MLNKVYYKNSYDYKVVYSIQKSYFVTIYRQLRTHTNNLRYVEVYKTEIEDLVSSW